MATAEPATGRPPLEAAASAARPPRMRAGALRRLLDDVGAERRARGAFPPGPARLDPALTRRMARDPLPDLLALYERHGPVFSVRILHARTVWMIGPEANHFMTVSHPHLFRWRDGSFGDLIPLLGDGLLTTDGAYHDRARRILMPAFHRERIEEATATMAAETAAALDGWRPGMAVDVHAFSRELAMRIAMRALLGLDPDDRGTGATAAHHFERALAYYGGDFHLRLLRGPGSPWRRMLSSRRVLDRIVYSEIRRRRRSGEQRGDVLSLLLAARDTDGSALGDEEVRDQVVTLMFAGHDTATATICFLLRELARSPRALAQVQAELGRELGGRAPTAAELAGSLPYLEMALDEALRLYPPAWIGPRRAAQGFEFAGQAVPAGAYVNYSSWASHRLAEVFPEPEAFVPERFERERKAALPRGAYVPFGGGSRICIGKRFGRTEVKLVAAMILQRHRLELAPGVTPRVRQAPTLSPAGRLEMTVRDPELPEELR